MQLPEALPLTLAGNMTEHSVEVTKVIYTDCPIMPFLVLADVTYIDVPFATTAPLTVGDMTTRLFTMRVREGTVGESLLQPLRYILDRPGNYSGAFALDAPASLRTPPTYLYVHQGKIILLIGLRSRLTQTEQVAVELILRYPTGVEETKQLLVQLPQNFIGTQAFPIGVDGPVGATISKATARNSVWVATQGRFYLRMPSGQQWMALLPRWTREETGYQELFQTGLQQQIFPLTANQPRLALVESLPHSLFEARMATTGLPLGAVPLPYFRTIAGRPVKHEWLRLAATAIGPGGAAIPGDPNAYEEIPVFRREAPWQRLTFPAKLKILLRAQTQGFRQPASFHRLQMPFWQGERQH